MPMTSAVFEMFHAFSRSFSTSHARSADSLNSRSVPASEPALAPLGVARAGRRRRARRSLVRLQRLGQIGRVDRLALGHDDEPLDRVAQLADVAAPSIALEDVHRRGRDLLGPAVVLAAQLVQEMLHEQRNVFRRARAAAARKSG